ncbi:MAG: ATP-dependent 6-phosphofructokinase [Planctomycetales bacterium]|nr:ATP-dependent 6-phosphofructokinase [Planctomycetales bacterium]
MPRPPRLRLRKIGILTGGGDCPGLNAAIRAATLAAIGRGWSVQGIPDGFGGLLDGVRLRPLGAGQVRGIAHLGGTILGTTNRLNPLQVPVRRGGGTILEDRGDRVVERARRLGLDAVVAIGGDGTLRIAEALGRRGLRVVGLPKTIDNDLSGTVVTFGFDTAVSTATDALDKLHPTAESHRRVMVVEVMGRHAGWIALHSGIAGGADAILIPEIPFRVEAVARKVLERERRGRGFSIIVAAEGARAVGGGERTRGPAEAGREVRLGGIGDWLASELARETGKEARSLTLGHLQRGGSPTTFDRLLATRLGAAAIRYLEAGRTSVMVGLQPPDVVAVPLREAVARMKAVPAGSDVIQSGRDMGIAFGDEAA